MLEDREKDKRCKSIVDLGGVSRSLNSPLFPLPSIRDDLSGEGKFPKQTKE